MHSWFPFRQIVIPRSSYAVLRFVTDDPGVWPLHCHIGWHLAGTQIMLLS